MNCQRYGLCRPSPTPLYAAQNHLPPLLSGQLILFLWTSGVVEASAFTASFLVTWCERKAAVLAAFEEEAAGLCLAQARGHNKAVAANSDAPTVVAAAHRGSRGLAGHAGSVRRVTMLSSTVNPLCRARCDGGDYDGFV